MNTDLRLSDAGPLEPLLSEAEAIRALGLQDRTKPGSSLRWLIRTGRLPAVRLARGVISFHSADIRNLINVASRNVEAKS